jgi:DNA (cytosine-5)-methyltransferase 1
MLTHLDLFSGIGGFALAARWAGIETVQFVEIDKFCQKVLAKQFPGVPIHDDITTYTPTIENDKRERGCLGAKEISGESINSAPRPCNQPFLLTGGFPCQPFSCAGKRRGKEDDRFLWPEMLRVVSEAKPTWVIGENVAGFINMGLDDCIFDLEGEGYEVQAFVIPACAVNAPHRRDRVWIVANRQECRWEEGNENAGRPRQGERTQGGGSGFADTDTPWLEVATRLCRVDDGLPRQVDRVNRLKSLGNAIVPQVAYEIMKAIIKTEENYKHGETMYNV